MDPLLRELEESKLGPSISGIYAGAYAHADDIRTITSSLSSLNQQVRMVQNFAKENALVLNPAKCEVLITSSTKPALQSPVCTLGDQPLFPQDCVKCLSYWGHGTSQPPKELMRPSRKPEEPFFPMELWEPFKES